MIKDRIIVALYSCAFGFQFVNTKIFWFVHDYRRKFNLSANEDMLVCFSASAVSAAIWPISFPTLYYLDNKSSKTKQ
jgi:hypothetical protein